jgi:hypothetical protein
MIDKGNNVHLNTAQIIDQINEMFPKFFKEKERLINDIKTKQSITTLTGTYKVVDNTAKNDRLWEMAVLHNGNEMVRNSTSFKWIYY